MAQVRLTSRLRTQLSIGALDPEALIREFSDWKDSESVEHYSFAKDGLNRNSKLLYHVHMVPLNVAEALDAWDYCWERYRKRTSDRYLFYTNGGPTYGYLLIALIDDPGAHLIWAFDNRATRSQWEAIADNFFHFGTIP